MWIRCKLVSSFTLHTNYPSPMSLVLGLRFCSQLLNSHVSRDVVMSLAKKSRSPHVLIWLWQIWKTQGKSSGEFWNASKSCFFVKIARRATDHPAIGIPSFKGNSAFKSGVESKLLFCNYISLWCQSQSSRVFFFLRRLCWLAVAEMMRFGAHAKRRFVWLSFLRITEAAEAVGKDMSSTEL